MGIHMYSYVWVSACIPIDSCGYSHEFLGYSHGLLWVLARPHMGSHVGPAYPQNPSIIHTILPTRVLGPFVTTGPGPAPPPACSLARSLMSAWAPGYPNGFFAIRISSWFSPWLPCLLDRAHGLLAMPSGCLAIPMAACFSKTYLPI